MSADKNKKDFGILSLAVKSTASDARNEANNFVQMYECNSKIFKHDLFSFLDLLY
jgi:hypothetical protein